jgi:hypothetical protein
LWHELLGDARLFRFLQEADDDLAAAVRAARCPTCGGPLHRAKYARKPRGARVALDPQYGWRHSFCCGAEGCRKRATPPSVRFLGRHVYLGAVVVLVSAMTGGITEKRAAEIRALIGVSVRTLRRWRVWWRELFVATDFWKAARARLSPPVETDRLPASLLERFAPRLARDGLAAMLRFLAPITTGSAGEP